MSEAPEAFLKRSLDELEKLHLRGGGGFELARRRADLVDLVLISVFREAERRAVSGGRYRQSGLVVVALGGYGRRELSPYSDVDLMLLYEEEEAGLVQEMAEALFYPLWDAGLELGHGARTLAETVEVAADSFEDQTSFLQARYLVGDQDLYREFLDQQRGLLQEDGGRALVERLVSGREERHREYGASAALLEPHLKEGRGGARDVHELVWAASVLGGAAVGVESLSASGLLTGSDLARLEGGLEVLLRARTSLHYAAGRKVDRLYLDYQDEVAGLMGGGPRADVDETMAAVTDAAHAIALLTTDAWETLLKRVGAPVGQRAAALPPDIPEDPAGRRVLLLELLREGYAGLPRLERLSHLGILSEWLPGWSGIRYLGQRDNLHTYTVDGHLLHCVAVIVDLATTTAGDRVATALASEIALTDRWEALLLAALLHDLGKADDSADHCEAGARMAREAAAALGVEEDKAGLIEFLVANHLLLVDTATRRDLEDERLLERIARRIGTRERARLLYVLTVADSVATGPASWTPWTAALVQELFFKVMGLLPDGLPSEGLPSEGLTWEGLPSDAGAVRTEALRSVSPSSAEVPAAKAAPGGPGREATDRGPHSGGPGSGPSESRPLFRAVVEAAGGPGSLGLEVREGQVEGVQELVVAGPVYPGLLTRLSGVLSHNDINIMSAQVQPGPDDLVTRCFQVGDQFEHGISRERWERVRTELARALEGRLALEYRLARKAARAFPAKGNRRAFETQVVVDNAASEEFTVVEVHAQDRIGLLHTLARALDDLLLEGKVAKVSTVKERVVDVFYVADIQGRKLTDPEHVRELKSALLFALAERA
ncbi:MAG: hypothetical protein Kow00129_04110 [Thermoleophilia bacterium]